MISLMLLNDFGALFWNHKFITPYDAIVRLLAAVLLALVVGLDRELKRKAVGMRAFMLASVGAAGYSLLAIELTGGFTPDLEAGGDPTRVIAGLMGAFGFLGAGAIIQSRGDVQGFASGAAIWTAGAIGMSCGMGYIGLATLVTGLTVLILIVSEFFQSRVDKLDERGSVRGGDNDG